MKWWRRLLVLLAIGSIVLVLWPSPIDPPAWRPAEPPPLAGACW